MTLALDEELEPRVEELLSMLTYKRPSGSAYEQAFINRYIRPLGAKSDEFGNWWLTIGESKILWSCHTDTVHKSPGPQKIWYGDGIVYTDETSKECLGADCTVGVWIMMNMIRSRVPGTYVFHCDEEIGGLGSSYIAKDEMHRLDGIDFAIAFDRKGYNEIITHQMSDRCASDAFAHSLAHALRPMHFQPSDNGTFTDTANYTHIVPECTNIAVGYFDQHTSKECLDIAFASRLLDQLIAADFSQLVCERDPNAYVWRDLWDRESLDLTSRDLEEFIFDNSDVAAEFIGSLGYTAEDLRDFAISKSFDQRIA